MTVQQKDDLVTTLIVLFMFGLIFGGFALSCVSLPAVQLTGMVLGLSGVVWFFVSLLQALTGPPIH